jgi:hypothetical protein
MNTYPRVRTGGTAEQPEPIGSGLVLQLIQHYRMTIEPCFDGWWAATAPYKDRQGHSGTIRAVDRTLRGVVQRLDARLKGVAK